MRAKSSALLGVALAAALGLSGGIPAQAQADARERTLFVSAVDSKGEPVEDLAVADVVVREDGVRREVLRLSRASEPIDIALLVDNSAAADEAILQIRDALQRFVAKMTPDHNIALVALADRPTIFVDYTNDRARLQTGIGRLFSMSRSGMTLLDAIIETARGLERRDTARAVIVPIVTDGVEDTNRYHRDVIDALRRAQAALHAIGIGQFSATLEDAARERLFVLDLGTRESGGQRITLLSPMGLNTALDRLGRELSTQY